MSLLQMFKFLLNYVIIKEINNLFERELKREKEDKTTYTQTNRQ
jgi:hypothetical protein